MGTVENICVGPKYIFIYSLVYSFIQLFINVRKSEGGTELWDKKQEGEPCYKRQ